MHNPDIFTSIYNKVQKNTLLHTSRREAVQKEYCQELIKRGLAITRSELKSKDRIDVRPMLNNGEDDLTSNELPTNAILKLKEEYNKNIDFNVWKSVTGYYCQIPCYSEGSLQLTSHNYIYWKILTLDMSTGITKIYLKNYVAYDSCWLPAVEGIAEFHADWNCYFEDTKTMSDIMKLIPVSEFLWSKEDKLIWNTLVKACEDFDENLYKQYETTMFKNIVSAFIKCIIITNYKLSQTKPVADRKSTNRKYTTAAITVEQPKKIIRTIGDIVFSSVKPPKSSSKETVIKYKVASWKARGGLRHMKDGRVIPFKESIRHRKCLNTDQATNVPVSVLKVQ